ncbi:MAG: hypothetical protein ACRDHY_03090, partial [Anaerolineales bacterium]
MITETPSRDIRNALQELLIAEDRLAAVNLVGEQSEHLKGLLAGAERRLFHALLKLETVAYTEK